MQALEELVPNNLGSEVFTERACSMPAISVGMNYCNYQDYWLVTLREGFQPPIHAYYCNYEGDK